MKTPEENFITKVLEYKNYNNTLNLKNLSSIENVFLLLLLPSKDGKTFVLTEIDKTKEHMYKIPSVLYMEHTYRTFINAASSILENIGIKGKKAPFYLGISKALKTDNCGVSFCDVSFVYNLSKEDLSNVKESNYKLVLEEDLVYKDFDDTSFSPLSLLLNISNNEGENNNG